MSFNLQSAQLTSNSPQRFSIGTSANTIRTAAVASALSVLAYKQDRLATVIFTGNFASGANLGVTSVVFADKLPKCFWPTIQTSYSCVCNTTSSVISPASFVIATDGTLTLNCPDGFTAATYNPFAFTVSCNYLI